jgi:hypothetical protein
VYNTLGNGRVLRVTRHAIASLLRRFLERDLVARYVKYCNLARNKSLLCRQDMDMTCVVIEGFWVLALLCRLSAWFHQSRSELMH